MTATKRIVLCAILLAAAALTACGSESSAADTGIIAETTTTSAAETTTTAAETTTSAAATTTAASAETSSVPAETTTAAPAENSYSDEALIDLARCYYGSRKNWVPSFIDVDGTDGDTVNLHLYDVRDYHTVTCDWYFIDRNTGKGTDFYGDPIDLTEPEAELYNPDVLQRNDLYGDVCCAVQYIGTFPMGTGKANGYNAALIETFMMAGYADEYPFLGKLMNDQHFAETQNAQELWLIIPRDRDAKVTVTEYNLTEGRVDGSIYSSYNGCPFLLYCNQSEISSDVSIQITDKKGRHNAFSVSISGMDGSPIVSNDTAVVLKPELHTHYGD